MATGMKCPNRKCGSTRIWRKGKTPTRQGEKQRYVCFTCGRTFYASDATRVAKPKTKSKKKGK